MIDTGSQFKTYWKLIYRYESQSEDVCENVTKEECRLVTEPQCEDVANNECKDEIVKKLENQCVTTQEQQVASICVKTIFSYFRDLLTDNDLFIYSLRIVKNAEYKVSYSSLFTIHQTYIQNWHWLYADSNQATSYFAESNN